MPAPTPADLQALTDEEFTQLRFDVATERARRDDLLTIPSTVDSMIQRFVDHGGDTTKLKNPNSYVKGPKP